MQEDILYDRNCFGFCGNANTKLDFNTNSCIQNETVKAILPNENEKQMKCTHFNHTC